MISSRSGQGDLISFEQAIKQSKTRAGVPFSEHAPLLHDISVLKSWKDVHKGVQEVAQLCMSCIQA